MSAKSAAHAALGTAAFECPVKRVEPGEEFQVVTCHGQTVLENTDKIGLVHSGDVLVLTLRAGEYMGRGFCGIECALYEGPVINGPQLDQGQFRFPDHNNVIYKPDEFVGVRVQVCRLAENPLYQRVDQSVREDELLHVVEMGYD